MLQDDRVRSAKAVDAINARGLSGLIVYSDGVVSLLRPSYLRYMSNLGSVGPNSAMVVSRDGRVVLLVEPSWDAGRAAAATWIHDVRGSDKFSEDLASVMAELGLSGTVGLAGGDVMTREVFSAASGLAELQRADDIIEAIAAEKSQAEIEHLMRVGKIADAGFETFLKFARVGIREYELSAEMEYAMRMAGADDNFTLLSSGRHSYAMHTPTDRRLEAGDLVLAEITPICEGQFVQLCRTVFLGDPSPTLVEKYSMLMMALEEALKAIRSGVAASGLSRDMNAVIRAAGYEEFCRPPYMRARGHGVGVGSMAPGGTIDDDSSEILATHQALIVHPNQYLPETGYLACGETVMVSDDGFVRLATTETKLYSKEV